MNSNQKQTSIDLLRAALRETTGIPEVDNLANASLLSRVVGDDAELLNVYIQEAGPQQVEVDLHLEGEGVDGHSTNAMHFATFVSRIAEAVKETAKDIAGRERYTTGLLIEGVRPGSVRVVLKAPEEKVTATQPFPGTDGSTIDSQALRRIAQVMTLASEADEIEGDALEAAVQQLPFNARRSLRTAVRESKRASWDIDGVIRERRKGIDRVQLSTRGASKLEQALGQSHIEHRTEEAFGTIDGLKYSLGVMWFTPETGGRSFPASVQDDKLLSRVAELATDHEQRVLAIFESYSSLSDGDDAVVKRSRVLRSVVAAPLMIQYEMKYDPPSL